MKKQIFVIILLTSLILIPSCSNKNEIRNPEENKVKEDKIEMEDQNMETIKITINEKEYDIKLEENETTKAFIKLLPQEFIMSDLNHNEKYVYMNHSLPTNSYNPKRINKGDIMLYGNNCLVIFYESFDTNYQYTKIGHIDNLLDFGKEKITVIFSK